MTSNAENEKRGEEGCGRARMPGLLAPRPHRLRLGLGWLRGRALKIQHRTNPRNNRAGQNCTGVTKSCKRR